MRKVCYVGNDLSRCMKLVKLYLHVFHISLRLKLFILKKLAYDNSMNYASVKFNVFSKCHRFLTKR